MGGAKKMPVKLMHSFSFASKLVIASEGIRCTNGVPHARARARAHTHTHTHTHTKHLPIPPILSLPLPRLLFSAEVIIITTIEIICPVQYTWLQRITAILPNVTRTRACARISHTHTHSTVAATTTTFHQLQPILSCSYR